MSLLQTAQNSWQSKVGDKDVDKFTVAGKMGGTTPNSKRPSRKESEMNAVNETHSPTVIFFLKCAIKVKFSCLVWIIKANLIKGCLGQ